MHKLSIITINFNNVTGLCKTIESVKQQTDADFEYIVIDGGSTDGSVDVIKKDEAHITSWLSESDRGIYHAMNKGLAKATGDYLLFLNSGDFLSDYEIIRNIKKMLDGSDLIYGNLLIEEAGVMNNHVFPKKLTFKYFLTNSLPHPCTFIKKSLFALVGCYNENLKISSDWEFFIKAVCKFNCTYKYINLPISVIDLEGISRDPANKNIIMKEVNGVLSSNFSAFMDDYEAMNIERTWLNKRIINKIKALLIKFKNL